MRTLVFAFCLTSAVCTAQKKGCPPKEDIKPCSCRIGSDKQPWISCDGLSDVEKLKKAVKGMQEYHFSNFHLEKSKIGVLPSDIFTYLEIESLNVMFSNLTALSENINHPPFQGLERSLQYLEIRDSFLDTRNPLSSLSLSHLKKLIFLQLEGNLMPTIGNDWFESGPYGLKELYLLDTYTKTLGSHAFTSLQNLKKFSLTGGKVSKISRDMFSEPALYLESLDFSNNHLSSLPKNVFSKMPSLQEVFFDNNEFTSIEEIVFAPVWSQLSHVFFTGNPLNCNKDLQWIFKYRLPESLQGNCSDPEILKSRGLSTLTLKDLQE